MCDESRFAVNYHAKEPGSVMTVKFELGSRSTKAPIDALSRSPEFVRML